jgi:hypothetical protein
MLKVNSDFRTCGPTMGNKSPGMKDLLAYLEKLRKDASECALVRDLATDRAKREMFDRLARHLDLLADEVERAVNASRAS